MCFGSFIQLCSSSPSSARPATQNAEFHRIYTLMPSLLQMPQILLARTALWVGKRNLHSVSAVATSACHAP